MKRILAGGILITGMLIVWGCGKENPPVDQQTPSVTKAPETKAPETKAPETKATETKIPETKAPDSTPAPETNAPTLPPPPSTLPPSESAQVSEFQTHTITDAEVGQKVKCTVLGTEITVTKETLSLEYKSKVYYFCCPTCPEEFKKNPDKYVVPEETKTEESNTDETKPDETEPEENK